MYFLGAFIGAMVITFVLSRIARWAFAGKDRRGAWIAALTTAVAVTVIYAYGAKSIEDFQKGIWLYLAGVAFWLAIDLYRVNDPRPQPTDPSS